MNKDSFVSLLAFSFQPSVHTELVPEHPEVSFDDVWCWQVQVTAGEEPSQLPGVERGGARVGPMPRSDLLALLERHTALFFSLGILPQCKFQR